MGDEILSAKADAMVKTLYDACVSVGAPAIEKPRKFRSWDREHWFNVRCFNVGTWAGYRSAGFYLAMGITDSAAEALPFMEKHFGPATHQFTSEGWFYMVNLSHLIDAPDQTVLATAQRIKVMVNEVKEDSQRKYGAN